MLLQRQAVSAEHDLALLEAVTSCQVQMAGH